MRDGQAPEPAASLRPQFGRNIIILSWVSLIQDIATEMIAPILPVFLISVLGAPVAIVSIVESFAEGANSLMKVASGALADRFAKTPLVIAGYSVAAASKLLLIVANTWPKVLASRVLDRVGKGLRTSPRDALINADVGSARRGRAFGFHRAMDNVGAVVGPLVGLGVFDLVKGHFNVLFACAAIPAILALFLLRLVKEPAGTRARTTDGASNRFKRPYWIALGILTTFNLANFSYALIIVRLRELGFTVSAVFGAYALYNVAYSGVSYPAGRLADRKGHRFVYTIGLIALVLAYVGLSYARSGVAAAAFFVVYGVFMACTDGVGAAWIARIAPGSRVGTALGLYYGFAGFATIGAGIWAGELWGTNGRLPFLVTACAAAATATALALWRRLDPHRG
jgi:MFS family permease